MEAKAGTEDYKSPKHKLVAFFKRSRDQWKLKMAKAKKDLKRLENRVRFLEKSREQWKAKSRELQANNARLQAELRAASPESGPQMARAPEKKVQAASPT